MPPTPLDTIPSFAPQTETPNMSLPFAHQLITQADSVLDKITSITPLSHGLYNWAFLVNNQWVFRFPKRSSSSFNRLQTEAEVLKYMHGTLPLATPSVLEISKKPEYIAIQFLAGKTPNPFEVYGWKQADITAAATTLADFLVELHQQALPPGCLIQRYDFGKEIQDIAAETKLAQSMDRLKPGTLNYIAEQASIATEWLQKAQKAPDYMVIHNDIHTENLVFDSSNLLTGVIDFDSVAYGLPELDFALIGSTMGWNALQTAVARYQKQSGYSLDINAIWALNVDYVVSLMFKFTQRGRLEAIPLLQWWLNTARPEKILDVPNTQMMGMHD